MWITVIIFQGLIFLVLIFVLRHFMKGHVTGAVSHLQKMNDELLKQQEVFKKKIAEADKEYQTKTAKLEREITERQAQAKTEVSETMENAKKQALEEKERIINEAVETRDKMRQEIMAQMEEKSILHSKAIIAGYFSEELKKLVHDYLIKEVMDGIREVDMESFQVETDEAELTCAMPLDEAHKKDLQKLLKEKIKKEVKFKEKLDTNLVGGMTMKLGTFVIDGSLANRLDEAASEIQRETARRYQSAG